MKPGDRIELTDAAVRAGLGGRSGRTATVVRVWDDHRRQLVRVERANGRRETWDREWWRVVREGGHEPAG